MIDLSQNHHEVEVFVVEALAHLAEALAHHQQVVVIEEVQAQVVHLLVDIEVAQAQLHLVIVVEAHQAQAEVLLHHRLDTEVRLAQEVIEVVQAQVLHLIEVPLLEDTEEDLVAVSVEVALVEVEDFEVDVEVVEEEEVEANALILHVS
jgi:hypothetical protein